MLFPRELAQNKEQTTLFRIWIPVVVSISNNNYYIRRIYENIAKYKIVLNQTTIDINTNRLLSFC